MRCPSSFTHTHNLNPRANTRSNMPHAPNLHPAEHIGTKTAVQVRSHAQKFFNKLERKKEAGEEIAEGVCAPACNLCCTANGAGAAAHSASRQRLHCPPLTLSPHGSEPHAPADEAATIPPPRHKHKQQDACCLLAHTTRLPPRPLTHANPMHRRRGGDDPAAAPQAQAAAPLPPKGL